MPKLYHVVNFERDSCLNCLFSNTEITNFVFFYNCSNAGPQKHLSTSWIQINSLSRTVEFINNDWLIKYLRQFHRIWKTGPRGRWFHCCVWRYGSWWTRMSTGTIPGENLYGLKHNYHTRLWKTLQWFQLQQTHSSSIL